MVGDYTWVNFGTPDEQERQMRRSCHLGEITLHIVENGWNGTRKGKIPTPLWDAFVTKWDQQSFMWKQVYSATNQFDMDYKAREHLEDWYANNVLFEHLMLGKDDGKLKDN